MSSKGYKHTLEAKKIMSEKAKNRVFSEETRKKLSESNKGKIHRWKGGISCGVNRSKYQRERMRNLRQSVINIMGGKCVKCGFTDCRALQIDHINGDGAKERRLTGYSKGINKHVLLSFFAGENKYQILCANCNWIKRFENNEC